MASYEFEYGLNNKVKNRHGTEGYVVFLGINKHNLYEYLVQYKNNTRWESPDNLTLIVE